MESAVPPLKAPALRALLDVEKDAPTRASLEAALALHTAADKSATPADLLQAVAALDANGAPTACNALNALADSADPAVAKAAQDALYRQRVAAQWGGFFEMFFFGLSLGSILVLAATGLAITFGVMGVINMAHGEFIMLGAYTAWGVQQMLPGRPGLALLLAVPAALLVSGGMGVLLERTVIRFLYGRPLETLLATFGVSLVLQQAVRSVFSPLNRAVQTPDFMSGVWQITPHFALTCNRVYIMLFCLGVFACIPRGHAPYPTGAGGARRIAKPAHSPLHGRARRAGGRPDLRPGFRRGRHGRRGSEPGHQRGAQPGPGLHY